MPQAHAGRACSTSVALDAVLTFSVPALRDSGASRGDGSLLFACVSISAMVARVAWGRLADAGGGRRRVATLRDVGFLACARRPADVGRVALRHRRADRRADRAEPRRARLQRRALPDRRGDRGRRARRPGGRAHVDRRCSAAARWPRSRSAPWPTAQGYRSLWLAAAAAAGLGVLATYWLGTAHAPRDGSRDNGPPLCCLRGCAVSGRTGARAHRRLARSGWARCRTP